MKFRKEYQTYLLIVIAIITAGYFLKPFFFNKKKKVVEGQVARRRVNITKIEREREREREREERRKVVLERERNRERQREKEAAFNQATTGQAVVPFNQTQFTYGNLAAELGLSQY